MKPSSFDPQWYEQQKDELLAEDNADQNLTWCHPMDVLLVIGLVLTLTCLFVGVFG